MDTQSSQSPFLNIPRRKINDAVEEVLETQSQNGVLTQSGAALSTAFQRYFDSNIPVDYWWRDMHDFQGPAVLQKYYTEVTNDIKISYREGKRACFAGKHGVGKTFVACCILKRVVEKQFSASYVNLVDIIHVMLNGTSEAKNNARDNLLSVDFLVIDEFDTRFMGSENAADLFGRILEPIMRTRIQNRLPLIFCTNSPKVEGSFSGPLEASIASLMNMVTLIPIIGGQDARQMIKKGEL